MIESFLFGIMDSSGLCKSEEYPWNERMIPLSDLVWQNYDEEIYSWNGKD
jgi:hypothetical protein